MSDSSRNYTTPQVRTLAARELLEQLGPQAGGSGGFTASGLTGQPLKSPIDRVLAPPTR